MKVSYFAIYDKKALTYGHLFPSFTYGSAERSLRDSVSSPDSVHSKYPDDFALYHVLDLDDESGQLLLKNEPPQLIVEASALKT